MQRHHRGKQIRSIGQIPLGSQNQDLHPYIFHHLVFILINEVTIRIYNLPRLGKIIDAVVEQGNELITLQ